ncbi:NACHT domain-containing protein [Streptomyces sp. NPDC001315]|uniref:NACHT N-terminal Helical domain 1-containing protein n=1 Tax=Streptomyces sp. NPDC001315 TaxID=3364562 RepID=UPI0036748299
MDPRIIGARLASSTVGPLVKRLFARQSPGAGLVDKPVRLSALVSFQGEQRQLTERDVGEIAAVMVQEAEASPGEPPFPPEERDAVVGALARRLLALGDLDMDDVQVVQLGHHNLARELRRRSPTDDLAGGASHFLDSLTEWACVHVLNFLTQRSTFVARTSMEQSRSRTELIARIDELITRAPRRDAHDSAFERRYLAYVVDEHSKLLLYGVDPARSPETRPLNVAYLSLTATAPEEAPWVTAPVRELEGAPREARADEALADHDRVLLRGDAGSGKTTLVQWLAVSAARQDTADDDRMAYLRGRIPFVLPVRTLTRDLGALTAPKDFLTVTGTPLAGEQPAGWASRVLAEGRGLVLVDGLDEAPERERAHVHAWLNSLVEAYPGNRWLVTSRPSALREDRIADEGVTELTLSPMRPQDVASFVSRWHAAVRMVEDPTEDAGLTSWETQLLHALRAEPDLGRLATNPLMCGLICALHRYRRGFLPISRKEVYEAALTMLLARRDHKRGPGPELSMESQLRILQRLAYRLIRNARIEMTRERALAEIGWAQSALAETAALGDPGTVLTRLLSHSGLLRVPHVGVIDFCHRTFQDYLGAKAALEDGDLGLLVLGASDAHWEGVTRMAVAQARPRERVWILRELLRDDSPRALLLAASCLDEATDLDPSVRAEIENRVALLASPHSREAAREPASADSSGERDDQPRAVPADDTEDAVSSIELTDGVAIDDAPTAWPTRNAGGGLPNVVSSQSSAPSQDDALQRPSGEGDLDNAVPPTLPPVAGPSADGGSMEPRSLVAELAAQTSPGREVPLHVQIVRGSGRGVPLRSFSIPRDGARVLVTLHAPGLVVVDELQQELQVVPGQDSDVLRFRLKAPTPGLHQVTVRAFRGGTFLGEVNCQISVGHGSVTRDGPQRHVPLPSMAFDPGEVTLQVLKDETAGTFSFQLIGETFYAPESFHFRAGDPRQATEQIYAQLRSAAKAAATIGGEVDARRLRDRLRNHGVQLWTSAVPQAVQSQFWNEADRVTSFTVLGEHDIVPWELLYPLNEGREDRGFLAEWLPVVRRVFGQDRVRSISLPGVAFVVPPGSPADAGEEVTSLRARLGTKVADVGVLTERAALTALIEGGHAGLLHFACHNAFTGTGSCVTMADGPFDPIDLASAAQLRTLLPHRPLVFFNACRSAGEIDWFGESLGWAPQFLNAGAGAFVGTLWPVRSQSALQFAEAFYEQLITHRQPLGQASLAARQTIRDLYGGDPAWLAYAVYGSPAATAHTTA